MAEHGQPKQTVEQASQKVGALGLQAQAIDMLNGGELLIYKRALKPLEIPTNENSAGVSIPAGCMLLVLDPDTAQHLRAQIPRGRA